MKKTAVLFLLLIFASSVRPGEPQTSSEDRAFNAADRKFIIENIGGIWEIEKRVFADGTELKPPQVRGYLVISASYWTQTEAQVVEAGGIKPFTGSFFGATDLSGTRSIEKVFLTIRTALVDGKETVKADTAESEQRTRLILEKDAVVQQFDGGGEVRMGSDRFSQKRGNLYTTYWKRIVKPEDMYK